MTTPCPSCFIPLPEDAFAWMCVSVSCSQRKENQNASAYLGFKQETGPVEVAQRPAEAPRYWRPTVPQGCRACKAPVVEVCPWCSYPLPPNWRGAHVTTVAMCGARSTGKSLYIAVVIKQLRRWLMTHRSTIEEVTTTTRDIYRDAYEKPLFVELKVMEPTARSESSDSYVRHPMIFSLGTLRGSMRYLVIRDVAGEQMENAPASARHLGFLSYADGVFFLFDPLAIPAISDKLRDLIPHQNTGGDPRLVLTNLRRLLGDATPRLAVVLSKFDAIQRLKDVDDVKLSRVMGNLGAAFMRDASVAEPGYNESDGQLLSLEIESLLHKLGAGDFVLSLGRAQGRAMLPHRFFAVSVLGESPDGDRLSRLGIAPFRIVDPVKWLLSEKGAI